NCYVIIDDVDHSIITNVVTLTFIREKTSSGEKSCEITLFDLTASAVSCYHCSKSYFRHLVIFPPGYFVG
ncbi:MAG: hypothetical protein ACTSWQ_10180, partial [Candidatus Thorarchaeota archaeon]